LKKVKSNFIFIDIDKCLFTTDKEFRTAVQTTFKNIKQTLGASTLYYVAEMEFISVNRYKPSF
jgi:hypothetical protein